VQSFAAFLPSIPVVHSVHNWKRPLGLGCKTKENKAEIDELRKFVEELARKQHQS
jgi:hypothetical protein